MSDLARSKGDAVLGEQPLEPTGRPEQSNRELRCPTAEHHSGLGDGEILPGDQRQNLAIGRSEPSPRVPHFRVMGVLESWSRPRFVLDCLPGETLPSSPVEVMQHNVPRNSIQPRKRRRLRHHIESPPCHEERVGRDLVGSIGADASCRVRVDRAVVPLVERGELSLSLIQGEAHMSVIPEHPRNLSRHTKIRSDRGYPRLVTMRQRRVGLSCPSCEEFS